MRDTITPSALDTRGSGIDKLFNNFWASTPFTDFEYVQVTFLGANTDQDVPHKLNAPTPEDVDYQVVRKDRACDIYNDTTGTRRAWGNGYITIRSTVSGAVVTLLLTVRRPT